MDTQYLVGEGTVSKLKGPYSAFTEYFIIILFIQANARKFHRDCSERARARAGRHHALEEDPPHCRLRRQDRQEQEGEGLRPHLYCYPHSVPTAMQS